MSNDRLLGTGADKCHKRLVKLSGSGIWPFAGMLAEPLFLVL